ncbi:MAG TPA: M50 family metallopeptidase [Candidatus Paceibacterota bacterium]|jgi:regulator of sigma E protease|nr:M50 family metallopeptidase [Candidatus Paceibacterota bacterium]HRS47757.1 M50 family metallopeptidase [Candidatus Paceibacterota bacterium]
MVTALIVILILGFLVIVHEFGHFLAAKKFGVWVEEFGIGLPPKIWSKKIGETLYSLNSLPIGGFVKIYGENEAEFELPDKKDQPIDKNRAFIYKPVWQKLIIVFCGVLTNFLIGFLILWFLFASGSQAAITSENKNFAENIRVAIVETLKDTPAQNAGLKAGDYILKLKTSQEEIKPLTTTEVQNFISQNNDKEIEIIVQRNNEELSFYATPVDNKIGIALAEVGMVKYPFFQAAGIAFKQSLQTSVYIFQALIEVFSNIFTKGDFTGVSGPVGVASYVSQAREMGIKSLLSLISLISLNLAVFNLLPLPALDGGKALLILIGKISKKPISPKVEIITNAISMAFLLILFVIITYLDIQRLI